MRSAAHHLPLLPILAVAIALRLYGLNWDDGHHLHPDERFIAMVSDRIALPGSIAEYFSTARSPLSPYNNGFDGFAYGTLPLFLGKWLGEIAGFDGYDRIVLLGRGLSAAADVGTLLFVYALAGLLYGRLAAIVAASVTALAVLPIQLSHFYAFDTFATFFIAWTLFFLHRYWIRRDSISLLLAGVGVGAATACKISAATVLPLVALAVLVPWPGRRRSSLIVVVRAFAIVGLAALATYRVAEPYAFLGDSPFDLRPNPKFIADMLNWVRISSGEVEVPYMIQWANTPRYAFVLESIVRWGLGPAAGLASLAGLALGTYRVLQWGPGVRHLLLVVWAFLNLLYFGGQHAKFMRYLLPLYPALAILAGFFIAGCWAAAVRLGRSHAGARRAAVGLGATLPLVVLIPTSIWALAFVDIYSRPNTRLVASRWLIENAPAGAALAVEHWDDALPLGIPGTEQKRFRQLSMNLYDEENPEKLKKLLDNLNRADYLILASNRLYGSIPRMPQRYPLATEYYRALFDGALGYEQVAEFTARPRFLNFEIVDDAAQEDFTVYDHPKVQIFRRSPSYDPAQTAALLGAVPLDRIQRVKATEGGVSSAPLLTATEWAAARAGGTWAELFDPRDFANRLALPVWWLAALLPGLAIWPILWRLMPHLEDGGYGIARIAGLLLVAWTAWLAASLKLVPFGRISLGVVLITLGLCSLLALRGRLKRFAFYSRSAVGAIAGSEIAFTIGFLVCLWMRLVNPDLWHPTFGGEKPMDLAYLNAVVKSEYFPPYDPWFAGGSINYYYFGWVLVAALIKSTGIVPATAYNLALALWMGLCCQTAFSLAYNLSLRRPLSGGRRAGGALVAGGLAAVFVALIGNLDGAVQLRDGLWKAGAGGFQSGIPLLGGLSRVLVGLVAIVSGARFPEFDFWRSTRLIGPEDPGPITEFPFFTFLYGDLHAHLLALPLTLLTVVLALELARSTQLRRLVGLPRADCWPATRELVRVAGLLGLAGLAVGALRATNTWDFPTYLAIVGVGLLTALRPRTPERWAVGPLIALAGCGLTLLVSSLLFWPYLERYQLFYGGVDPSPARTDVWQFLAINGLWYFILIGYLAVSLLPLVQAALRSEGSRPSGVAGYYSVVLPLPIYWVLGSNWGVVTVAVALVGLILAVLGWGVVGLNLALATALGAVILIRWSSGETVFTGVLGLVGLAALTLPEIVAIKGDVGRMNTVFKFYFQAWVLFGVLSAVWLVRVVGRAARPTVPLQVWRRWWLAGLVVLLAAALIYPVRGAPVRLAQRFGPLPTTLDGMAFMASATYRDRERDLQLPADHAAIQWLQENVAGTPVVLEASIGLYKWGSRISIYTGLPTVIGWDWHQKQQRVAMTTQVEERLKDVRTIYEAPRLEQVLPLLRKYDVAYIYVGGLERAYFPANGLKKFEEAPSDVLKPVYQKAGVTVYQLEGQW